MTKTGKIPPAPHRVQDHQQVSYQYNAIGDLVEMTDWTGTTSFEVDLLSRITKTTDTKGKVVEYTYDATGNQTSVTYPDTSAIYDYGLVNNQIKVTGTGVSETAYTYDGNPLTNND